MDCFLHIGTGKTGTTTIQDFLAANRRSLSKQGILYPKSPGKRRHVRVSFFARNDKRVKAMNEWKRRGGGEPDTFREEFRAAFLKEIDNSNAQTTILSDEALSALRDEEIARLKELLDACFNQVHVIIYLRRQDDYIASRYQQDIKKGRTYTLDEYLRRLPRGTYDYHAKCRRFARYFGKGQVLPRVFDRESFVGGSLLHDFASATGIPDSLVDLTIKNKQADGATDSDDPESERNRSLDARRTEFLRRMNFHFDEIEDPRARNRYRRAVTLALVRRSDGPVLAPDDSTLDKIMEQFADSNAAVAKEYLGRKDGILFSSTRRQRETVSEIELDTEDMARISLELGFDIWERKQGRQRGKKKKSG